MNKRIKEGMKLKLGFGIPGRVAKFIIKRYKHGLGLCCINGYKPEKILLKDLDKNIIKDLEKDGEE